ncbi:TetR/AcrR family transcriptional regulator [Streptomyces sp. AC555_RSS877]|uniref:TetR/AcrR family transcriptional regulator n=1 Tax=Streptomyces sp. AC555_RSS877 TaxID=2823688 RepID=UPI001C251AF1|nr:TetR/AcrR family transcriptional regulator [Streptomyces sp. AC555_RSS877]
MQERAAQTHRTLIRAAAVEFDRRGYEGASLARISKGARTSMGALTFHFPTKRDLAEAVREAGREAVVPVVKDVMSGAKPPLEAVADLTSTLVRLPAHDVVTRAALRLERDAPQGAGGVPGLDLEWVSSLHALLERALGAGQLRPGVRPETVAALLTRLVAGCWAEIGRGGAEAGGGVMTGGGVRTSDGAESGGGAEHPDHVGPTSASAGACGVWELILHGISAAGPPGAAGSG